MVGWLLDRLVGWRAGQVGEWTRGWRVCQHEGRALVGGWWVRKEDGRLHGCCLSRRGIKKKQKTPMSFLLCAARRPPGQVISDGSHPRATPTTRRVTGLPVRPRTTKGGWVVRLRQSRIGVPVGWRIGWWGGWSVGWSVGGLAGWLVGWWVFGWLVGRLVGW